MFTRREDPRRPRAQRLQGPGLVQASRRARSPTNGRAQRRSPRAWRPTAAPTPPVYSAKRPARRKPLRPQRPLDRNDRGEHDETNSRYAVAHRNAAAAGRRSWAHGDEKQQGRSQARAISTEEKPFGREGDPKKRHPHDQDRHERHDALHARGDHRQAGRDRPVRRQELRQDHARDGARHDEGAEGARRAHAQASGHGARRALHGARRARARPSASCGSSRSRASSITAASSPAISKPA